MPSFNDCHHGSTRVNGEVPAAAPDADNGGAKSRHRGTAGTTTATTTTAGCVFTGRVLTSVPSRRKL